MSGNAQLGDHKKQMYLGLQAQSKLIDLSQEHLAVHHIHLQWKDQQKFMRLNQSKKTRISQTKHTNRSLMVKTRRVQSDMSLSLNKMSNKKCSCDCQTEKASSPQSMISKITRYISLKIPKGSFVQQKINRIHSFNQNSKSHETFHLYNDLIFKQNNLSHKKNDIQKQRFRRKRIKSSFNITQSKLNVNPLNNVLSIRHQKQQSTDDNNKIIKTFTINSLNPPEDLISTRRINCQNPFNVLRVHFKIKKDSNIRKLLISEKKYNPTS